MQFSFKTFFHILFLSVASCEFTKYLPQEETKKGRHEYHAVLVTQDGSFSNCTGSLIGPRHVLTSGWCASKVPDSFSKVQIGRHDLSDNSEDYEEIKIASAVIDDKNAAEPDEDDEDDDGEFLYLDTVGILKLESVSSICPVTYDTGDMNLSAGKEMSVLGWGLLSDEGDDIFNPNFNVEGLLETETKVILYDKCFVEEPEDDRFLCSNSTDIESYFCVGDVGSAVIVKGSDSDSDVQVGLDFGFGACAPLSFLFPGFSLRLSFFQEFIECVLDCEEDCGKTIVVIDDDNRGRARGFFGKLFNIF